MSRCNRTRGHGRCAEINLAGNLAARTVNVSGADAWHVSYVGAAGSVLAYRLLSGAATDIATLADASGWLMPGESVEIDVSRATFLVLAELAVAQDAIVGQVA